MSKLKKEKKKKKKQAQVPFTNIATPKVNS